MVTLAVPGYSVLAITVGASQVANRWCSIRAVPDAVVIDAAMTAKKSFRNGRTYLGICAALCGL